MFKLIKNFSKKINFLVNFLFKIYRYNILAHFKVLPPVNLLISITPLCNFHCQMCDIWRKSSQEKQELKFSDWQRVMTDPIFSSIEVLNITGGEPFLYPELRELINLYLESMPKLKFLSINTNGFFTSKIVSLVKDLHPIFKKRGIKFIICVALDGIGEKHDYLRGFPGAFHNVEETLLVLKKIQEDYDFIFLINCVISHKNLYEVDKIKEWCKRMGILYRFSLVGFFESSIYNNKDKKKELDFTEEDKEYLFKILENFSSDRFLVNSISYYFYDMLHLYKNKSYRTIPCSFTIDGFEINGFGEFYYCFREKKIGNFLNNFSISEIYYKPENLAYRNKIKKTSCIDCNATCLCEAEFENNFLKLFWFNLTGRRSWW